MGDVVDAAFRTAKLVVEADEDAVAMMRVLQNRMDEVRAGHIAAIAIATVTNEGAVGTCWHHKDGGMAGVAIVGAVSRLRHYLDSEYVDTAFPETEAPE